MGTTATFVQVLQTKTASWPPATPPNAQYTHRHCRSLQTHSMSGANFQDTQALNERSGVFETSGLLKFQAGSRACGCGSLSGLSTVKISRIRTPSVRTESTEWSLPPARIARPASLLTVTGLKLS
jgi:hypothetical protein